MVGQCSGPALQRSSCKIWRKGIMPPSTAGSAPGSSSALASIIFTDVFFSSGRLDRDSRVAASTGGPPKPAGGAPPPGRAAPGGGPNGVSGPPGCPSVRPGSAPDDENAPPFTSQVLPASASAASGFDPAGGGGTSSGAMSNAAGDMKITPFTPTPLGPYSSGRPM